MAWESLSKEIKEDRQTRERFIKYAFEENKNIKDFGDFEDAIKSAFSTPKGENAGKWFNAEILIELFESEECKEKMKGIVTDEEYEKLYGDGIEVQRIPLQHKQVLTISDIKRHPVKSYTTKKGIARAGYSATRFKWKNPQMRFLKERKAKGIKIKSAIQEYRTHFKDDSRTDSSIVNKYYRI